MSIIISLTSTSIRLPILRYTLISLLNQDYKAEKIIVNLSKDKYLIDQGIQKLPDWLKELEENGSINISWVQNNGPYRKLLPVYEKSKENDIIITCDDDVIYGPKWLTSLLGTAESFPDCIICGRARVPLKTIGGRYQSYINWPLATPGSSGYDLVPTGVSGVLYRKPLLSKIIMESHDFKDIAPKQDDLWFKLAHELMGTKVVVSKETYKHINMIEAPGALTITNVNVKNPVRNSLVLSLSSRLKLKAKAYLGFPTCGNDEAIQRIQNYKLNLCTRQKNHPHPIFIGLGVKKLTNCRNTVLSLLKNTK
ncbi:glycosyltransferase family A protein [Psychrobacter pocilloporae]|uniref:glycosyltransferase family A protein n=1 Tax=Psychrobacter pocilloporae TaxID=1775882 RepID=UPI003C2E01E7